MSPCEVDQFAVQLRGRQSHDRSWGVKLHGAQGPVQPHHGILEDVVRVFPAADSGVAAEHPVGQGMQSVAAEFDDPIPGGEVTPLKPLQAFGQGCRDRFVGIVGIHEKAGHRGWGTAGKCPL